ncbi:hypothetical protein NFI95_16015 [Acetobacteraceae bacterium KSS8]|uniref:ABC transmembrane type-1 domain-containing protein n=1 Tax=Endosaccharibacter trunci TaxID=2812733 RepID=A0ABT1WAP3_9PROT|nr:hypothetical protein [Acetobacteraceae bacterium KSS8]
MTGWVCLPLSALLAGLVTAAVARSGVRVSAFGRTVLVALLLPGLFLTLRPDWFGVRSGPALIVCRVLGTLPLLALPALWSLGRMPKGQVRAARGLGAGAGAQFRLLWWPQMGPACLAGLLLAGGTDAAALLRTRHHTVSALSAPSPAP